MFFLKLGLLTCAFYIGLTIVVEAVLWAVIYFNGLGLFVSVRHPGWSLGSELGLKMGLAFGVIFGVVWLISFAAAWRIVFLDLRSQFSVLSN
jgi:hypothetical protein